MNVEKLKRLQEQVRIGGKGTPRRKRKVTHQTAATDDKKLQSSLKKLSVSTIPGIEEVNIIKDDLTVIHFNNPKAQASLSANTFAVSGHGETKKVVEMVPEILPQLGQETVVQLREFANSMTNKRNVDISGQEKFKSKIHKSDVDDDDDVPMLVNDFDEIAKSEDLVTGKLKIQSDTNVSIEENAQENNFAQQTPLNITDTKEEKKFNTYENFERNSSLNALKGLNNDMTMLEIESDGNRNILKGFVLDPEKDEQILNHGNKSTSKPMSEKKDTSSKKYPDSKAKQKQHANKNEEIILTHTCENVLSELKQANTVDLITEVNLQNHKFNNIPTKQSQGSNFICDDITLISDKLKEKFIDDIEAQNTKFINPLPLDSKILDTKPSATETCTSLPLELNKVEIKNSLASTEPVINEQFMTESHGVYGVSFPQDSNTEKNIFLETSNAIQVDTKTTELPEKTVEDQFKIGYLQLKEVDLNDILSEDSNLNKKITIKDNLITNKDLKNKFIENKLQIKSPDKAAPISKTSGQTENSLMENAANTNLTKDGNLGVEVAASELLTSRQDLIAEDSQKKLQGQQIEILQKVPQVGLKKHLQQIAKAENEQKTDITQEKKNQNGVLNSSIGISEDLFKNKTKVEELQERECKYELLSKTGAPSEGIFSEIVQKSEKDTERSITLHQDEENVSNILENNATQNKEIVRDIAKLSVTQSKEINFSEKKLEPQIPCVKSETKKNATATSKTVKGSLLKQNDTKKQSMPSTTKKGLINSNKPDVGAKPKQTSLPKNQAYETLEVVTATSKVQQMAKSSASGNPDISKGAQKLKQQPTGSLKPKASNIKKSENVIQPQVKQKISEPSKGSNISIKTSPSDSSAKMSLNQTALTAGNQKRSKLSAEATKTASKENTTERTKRVENQSASTGTIQKQTNSKAKHSGSTTGKAEPASKNVCQLKPIPPQNSTCGLDNA